MIIWRKKTIYSSQNHKWHRKFLWRWTWVQTMDEFHSCSTGTSLCWLETVWRQDISATAHPIYRHVRGKKHPDPNRP